jgi:replicative DNA helicase
VATDTTTLAGPPCDDGLEQQILAWCLCQPAAMAWAADNLQVADFYRTVNQRIFREMLTLYRESPTEVTLGFLATQMHERTEQEGARTVNLLEVCGGVEYLRAIVYNWASLVDGRGAQYVRGLGARLRDLRRVRDLRVAALEIVEQIDRAPGEVEVALGMAQTRVTEIAHDQPLGSKLQEVGEVACAVTQWIDAERKRPPGVYGLRSGLKGIDEPLQGLYAQRLVLVKGQTKFGKTTLCGQLIWQTAVDFLGQQEVGQMLAFVLEGSKEAFLRRFVSWQARVPSDLLKPGGYMRTNAADREVIARALGLLPELPLQVTDACPDITRIEAEIRNARMRGPLLGVLIDYGQLITGGEGSNQERQYANIAERLQLLANEIDAPIVVPSQVTKRPDGSFAEKGATAWRDNCTLALHVNRGEAQMGLHERLKSPRVDILCEAARDDAPFGLVTCYGAFSHYRLYDDERHYQEEMRYRHVSAPAGTGD